MNPQKETRLIIGGLIFSMPEGPPVSRRELGPTLLRGFRQLTARKQLQGRAKAPTPSAQPVTDRPRTEPRTQPAQGVDNKAMLEQSRMVFGVDLEPGTIVLKTCIGKYCSKGTTHALGIFHELTIMKIRGVRLRAAITVDEDGNQQGFEAALNEPVRVKIA